MKELKNLSIVVPTYNRQAYIERQIRYWQGCPVTLYILDGSEKPLPPSRTEGLHDNVKYYHMPYSITERLSRSAELVVTPYVMLLGDDEFFVPSALIQCIHELDDDNELISCMGLAAQFWYGPGKKVLGKNSYQRLKDYRVDGEHAAERMIYHMNPYICSTIYSVMRSRVWINNVKLLAKSSYSSPVISEVQFELSTCCQGKSKVINQLMWLRSGENPPVSLRGWDRNINFHTWYEDPRYAQERKEFIDTFVNHFTTDGVSVVSSDDVEKSLSQLNNYLLQIESKNMVRQGIRFFLLIVKNLVVSISPRLLKVYRKIASDMHYYIYNDKELSKHAAEMDLCAGCSVDTQAVSRIESIVREFRLSA